jgi:succinate dehydrogenase hydrophobic anchor subunit
VRRRRFKRRLFWTGVILAILLIWLIAQILRAAEATAAAARRPFRRKRLAIPR